MTKTTEAQKRATQAYREKNKERTRKQSAKSSAKTFIRKYADLSDLEELETLIESKKETLNNEDA